MRKFIAISLAMILIVSLAACGGGGSGTEEEGYTAENPLVFKVAHVEATSTFLHQSVEKWKEYVEKETEGKVVVEIYPNGELGADDQVIESIRMGTIHMSISNTSIFTVYDERLGLTDLPFLFKDVETNDKALRGGLGDQYKEWMGEEGFYVFGFQYDGMRGLSNSIRPVSTPVDMNGLKIRVMQSEMYLNIFKALGANPTPMSFTEVHTGLQQGTIDGQDNSPMLTFENKFYEAQPYYTPLGHTMSNSVIVSDKAFIEGLPEEIRGVMQAGADEFLVNWQRTQAMNAENDYLQKMRDNGVEVTLIEDKTPFVEAVQSVYDTNREKFGDEVIDQIIELAKVE